MNKMREAWEVAADEAGYISPDTRLAFKVGFIAAIADVKAGGAVAWMYKNKNTDAVYLRWTAPDESFKPTPLYKLEDV